MYKDRLEYSRAKNNYTKRNIAKILDISEVCYGRYESEKDLIPIKHLNTICSLLNISIDYVLNLTSTVSYPTATEKIDTAKSKNRLKELRNENNLTQDKLAKELNSAKTTISGYERGARIIATPFLYDICKKYNVSADYLLGKVDDPKNLK